jgi:hypothetical protein
MLGQLIGPEDIRNRCRQAYKEAGIGRGRIRPARRIALAWRSWLRLVERGQTTGGAKKAIRSVNLGIRR